MGLRGLGQQLPGPGGGLIGSLWCNAGTLQHYGVAFGYDGPARRQGRNDGATSGWFAMALWQVLDSY